MDDSELHNIAKKEVESKTYDKNIWHKALALTGGNEIKAKEKYIKLKIVQLKRDGIQPKKTPINEDAESPKKSTNKPKEKPESKQNSSQSNSSNLELKHNKKPSDKKSSYGWVLWVLVVIFIFGIVSNNKNTTKKVSSNSYSTSSNYSSDYSSTKKDDHYENKSSLRTGNCEVTIFNDGSIGATIDGTFKQWKTMLSWERKQCENALKEEQKRTADIQEVNINYSNPNNCENGDIEECFNLGQKYANGEGVKQSYDKASEFFSKACNRGYAPACTNLGLIHSRNEDYKKAIYFSNKGCNGGDAKGCYILGLSYLYGEGGLQQSNSKAKDLFYIACTGGYATGCTNVGLMYAKALGVNHDSYKTITFARKGCNGGDAKGCYILGSSYLYGEGGLQQSNSKAKELFARACNGGYPDGCKEFQKLDK